MHSQKTQTTSSNKPHIEEAAGDLLREGKKFANVIYKNGTDKVIQAEDNIKEYSDKILTKVQDNPLASILIAGGIGFLLSLLLKK